MDHSVADVEDAYFGEDGVNRDIERYRRRTAAAKRGAVREVIWPAAGEG